MVLLVSNQRLITLFPMFRENGCFFFLVGALGAAAVSCVLIHLQTPCLHYFLSRKEN